MQLSGAPSQIVLAWGTGDSSKTNPIPVPSQQGIKPGAASWTDGFPPLCATPVSSGGVPPFKADMDGVLYQMSGIDVWMCAGGGFPYSSAFSSAVGGYPKGSRVLMASGLGYWQSTADNNTTDPDTGGAGWIPLPGGNALISVATSSVAQTFGPGATGITFDTVVSDAFSMFNATDKYFIAPWAGLYRLSGAITLSAPSGELIGTLVNNSFYSFQAPQVSNVDLTFPWNRVVSLAAGDALQPYLSVAGSVSVTSVAGSAYAEAEFLGAA